MRWGRERGRVCQRRRGLARWPDQARRALDLASEGEVDGVVGVQAGGIEDRYGRVVLPDEQVDLGAAEKDALGAAAGELAHDSAVLLARLGRHDPDAKLV